MQNGTAMWGNIWQFLVFSYKAKHILTYNSTILFLSFYPSKMRILIFKHAKNLYTRNYIQIIIEGFTQNLPKTRNWALAKCQALFEVFHMFRSFGSSQQSYQVSAMCSLLYAREARHKEVT